MKSSFLVLFPLLALGIYLGSLSIFNPWLFLVFFLILSGTWLILAYKGYNFSRLFWLTILCGTMLLGQMTIIKEATWETPSFGEYRGEIYSVQPLTFDQRTFVRLIPSGSQVAVHLPKDLDIKVGSELSFTGEITRPPSAPNPGVFDYRAYLSTQFVYGLCYPQDYTIRSKNEKGFLVRLKSKFSQNIKQYIKEPALPLALVLGDRTQLSKEQKENWRLLGISHLLAISGMHVGFLALFLTFIVKFIPLRSAARLLVSQLLLLIYIVLAGSSASAWRAFLVSALAGYGVLRGRERNALHNWAMVGSGFLLLKPELLFSPSFSLSFLASGGILLWAPLLSLKSKSKVLNYLAGSLLISLVAQLSLMPLLVHYFSEIALIGPLTTLLFLPLVVVLLLFSLLVALGLGPLGLGKVCNVSLLLLTILENYLLPMALQWQPKPESFLNLVLWWIFFIYLGFTLRRPQIIRPKKTYLKLLCLVIFTLLITNIPASLKYPLEVTAVNVGQGDCYYIRTPNGLHLLIDGGGDSPYWQARGRNVGEERLVPYLKYRQVEKLDFVILSHPHEDHLFGLLAVLEHFEVGQILDNGHSHTSPTYERYLDLIKEKNIPYKVIKAGDEFSFDSKITLRVLYPASVRPDLPSAHNNNSLLLRLQYGGIRLLFTGDLEWPVLYDLANDSKLDLAAQWLKIPHHGSRGSLYEGFYERVNPSWATISAGPNSFGHPHAEVLDYLDQQQVSWRLTEKGPVTFQVWWGLWGRFADLGAE